MSVGVFISYNHADIRIANTLKTCLNALSDEIKVFIDHAGLVAGEEYEPTLARNIAGSQWFLMVCSGPTRPERDMNYCFMEVGQFRAKLLGENCENFLRSRLVAIYDEMRPRAVSQFQSVRISTLDQYSRPLDLSHGSDSMSAFETTGAFKLFSNILQQSGERPLRNMADADVRGIVREQAQRLIRAFLENTQEYVTHEVALQPRISFRLQREAANSPHVLSDSTVVTGYDATLKDIFSFVGTETTWGYIKQRMKEADGNDPLWITDVEAAAAAAAKDYVPEQPDGLCVSVGDKKFYRVLFARYELYNTRARMCYIVFIPSRPRQFDVRKKSSILLSALILSIRFRQQVLPCVEVIRNASRTKKVETLLSLERTLHQVETEAIEFGLNMGVDDDELPLLEVVRPGESHDFLEQSIADWTNGRSLLGTAITKVRLADSEGARTEATNSAEDVVVKELEKVRLVNSKFIRVLTEELLYLEKIEQENP